MKKNTYRFAVALALAFSGIFLWCDMGVSLTPLTKLFILFFGGVVGLQCVPAAVLFVSMVKGAFTVNQNNPLTGNGVKS